MFHGTGTTSDVKRNALASLHELSHTPDQDTCAACERVRVLVITEARRLGRLDRFRARLAG